MNTQKAKKLSTPRGELWYLGCTLHREDGPAITFVSGTQLWYQNGRKHRLDGPSSIFSDGTKAWHIEGVEYSEEEFNKMIMEA